LIITYTDGTVVNLGSLTPTQEGTPGLDFTPYPTAPTAWSRGRPSIWRRSRFPPPTTARR
jgi:hypothetical protein